MDCFSATLAIAEPDFVVVSTKIDNVRDQKNVFQVAQECDNNSICTALMTAASSYFQIPIDKLVSGTALLANNKSGEGTFMTIGLPSGYSYCKSQMRMVSIVPRDGDRGSTFLGRADAKGMYAETWTPVQGIGQGRSWVEAEITLVGVLDSLASWSYSSGTCRKPESRNLFYCRGGGCVNTNDDGQRVPSAARPPANGRN